MDTTTPGQGNCFFHAVWQQLQRPEISLCGIYQDHKNLQRCIGEYVFSSPIVELSNYKTNFDDLAVATSTRKWNCFFEDMKRQRVWVEGPVVQVAA